MAPLLCGALADRERAALGWARLTLRALLAAGLTAALDMAWLAWTATRAGPPPAFLQQALAQVAVPVLALAAYAALALVLWAVWSRPLLLLVYGGMPVVAGWFAGGAAVADAAGRAFEGAGLTAAAGAAAVSAVGLRERAATVAAMREGIGTAGRAVPVPSWPWQDPAAGDVLRARDRRGRGGAGRPARRGPRIPARAGRRTPAGRVVGHGVGALSRPDRRGGHGGGGGQGRPARRRGTRGGRPGPLQLWWPGNTSARSSRDRRLVDG